MTDLTKINATQRAQLKELERQAIAAEERAFETMPEAEARKHGLDIWARHSHAEGQLRREWDEERDAAGMSRAQLDEASMIATRAAFAVDVGVTFAEFKAAIINALDAANEEGGA